MTYLRMGLMMAGLLVMISCKKQTENLKPQAAENSNQITATPVVPLVANFSFTTADSVNIFENQSIEFNNLSTGYKTCVWEFGNTTKTQAASPDMSYPMHGYYTVKLTVFDANGNKQTFTRDISILCLYYNGVHPDGTSSGG